VFSLFTVLAIDLFLKTRLKEALKDKKAAEKEAGEFKEAKEAVESEKDALKEKVGELEKKLADAHSTVEEGRGRLLSILMMASIARRSRFCISTQTPKWRSWILLRSW
jgi:signal transduction histidine kinase